MIRILIVEDEEAIANLIRMNLTRYGYSCRICSDGLEACDLLESDNAWDLVLLDIMLPGANGFEVMEFIKPLRIPVIFLTAKSGMDDKLKGLTSGADDYIVKPFEIVELLARINIVLKRYHKTDEILTFNNIKVNPENRTVYCSDVLTDLTPREFDLFLLLLRNKNITLFRETIYEKVWGKPYDGDTRTLDLHIRRLRQKLNLGDELKTIYGIGYRLNEHEI